MKTLLGFIRESFPKAQVEKIYSASKNGWKAKDFHKHVEKTKPTVTLVKTKIDFIFGGFTNESWNESEN